MSSPPHLEDWPAARKPLVLGLFRIVLGLPFAGEGAATVFGVMDRKTSPVGDRPFWYAGVIELTCGGLAPVLFCRGFLLLVFAARARGPATGARDRGHRAGHRRCRRPRRHPKGARSFMLAPRTPMSRDGFDAWLCTPCRTSPSSTTPRRCTRVGPSTAPTRTGT
ncbi:hypothetical protein [Streptomyces caniscabiei]|uniref:hypothetical protein n=1 Tax=Streptomyces caniscabiei TaxID=2746961 RepID=UPI00211AA90E|nr:hypothetical protein [Streptomyces caniscabiei]